MLVDGDDMDEPVADAVRGIVDGHIVLSRTLANSGHFPAIDVLASVSRLSGVVYNDTTAEIARRGRQLLAEYASVKDLIDVGAYVKGANPTADAAIATKSDLDDFLRQASDERIPRRRLDTTRSNHGDNHLMSSKSERISRILRLKAREEDNAASIESARNAATSSKRDRRRHETSSHQVSSNVLPQPSVNFLNKTQF